MSAGRDAILGRIRAALGKAESPSAPENLELPRGYRRDGSLTAAARMELFAERLRDYGVEVAAIAESEVAKAVAARLTARGAKRVAYPSGLRAEWRPAGFEWIEGDALEAAALDALDGVMTGCSVAIAETGTLVLQMGPGQGPRRLSLVPDYHLCVVTASQLVETVPEAFARLEASGTLPTTFISGPSATSDIEMTRVRGVHGPRTLDVLVVLA